MTPGDWRAQLKALLETFYWVVTIVVLVCCLRICVGCITVTFKPLPVVLEWGGVVQPPQKLSSMMVEPDAGPLEGAP